MILFGGIHFGADAADYQVGALALVGLVVCGIWALARGFFRGPKTPEPWDAEAAAEIEGENAAPLCPHCLARHGDLEHFCPDCGAPVGAYTNLLPFPYLFSVGHVLRIGTRGAFKRSRFVIIGFVLLAIAEYAVFAPVYWYLLLKNIARLRGSNQAGIESAVDARK